MCVFVSIFLPFNFGSNNKHAEEKIENGKSVLKRHEKRRTTEKFKFKGTIYEERKNTEREIRCLEIQSMGGFVRQNW